MNVDAETLFALAFAATFLLSSMVAPMWSPRPKRRTRRPMPGPRCTT